MSRTWSSKARCSASSGSTSVANPAKALQVEVFLVSRGNPSFRVLVLKRVPQRGGFWQPVSGNVEDGESFIQTARREVMEETGITEFLETVDPGYEFHFGTGPIRREHAFGFVVEGTPRIVLSGEHTESRWVEPREAFGLLHWEENKEALRRILAQLNPGSDR